MDDLGEHIVSSMPALNRALVQTVITAWMFLAVCARAEVGRAAPDGRPGVAHALTPDQLGVAAEKQYHGDGLAVQATADGTHLRCRFQNLEGQATPEGLWLTSTVSNQAPARFCLRAAAVGREGGASAELAAKGDVRTEEHLARWVRPSLTEEYTVSVDGVRQDFIVQDRPAGDGALRLELALSGVRAAGAGGGVHLVFDGSGRKLVYSRLQAVDASNRVLAAHFVVQSANRLAVVVDDSQAVYPVRIDPTYSDANWTSLGGYNGVNGGISAVVVDGTGSIYAGGTFTVAGTVAANNVAKWDGSSWSPLGPGVNNAVYALALDGVGNLYAGGNFAMAGGVFSPYLARWDGTNWWSVGAGVNGMVRALLVSGTNLYAGGDFTMAGGNTVSYMAKWNGTTWSSAGAGFDSSVYALVADGAGNIYAGGGFFGAGSFIAHSIAKWDGSAWSPLGQGVNAAVYALAISGTNLYAGGNFTSAGSVGNAEYIAKWNGSAWSRMGAYGLNYPVKSLAADGSGNVYAGGMFLGEFAGTNANYIAKWDGSKWSSLGAGSSNGADSYVLALAVSGTNLIAAGGFTAMGGKPTGGLATWNGTAWSTPTADMNAGVLAMVVDGSGNVYAGGSFTSAGGNTVNHVARWNGSAWLPVGSGLGSRPGLGYDQTTYEAVTTLAMDGSGNLYAGGSFTNAGSLAITNVAKWNGSTWSNLGTGLGSLGQYGSVSKLAWDGTYSTLYAVGGFARAGSGGYTNVAKWNGTAWSSLGSGLYYKPGYGSSGNALAVSGANVYVGGNFWQAGGVNATNIAKWNGSAWSSLGPGINTSISALAVDGTYVYAAGMFSSLSGVAATNIARWNGSTWSALGGGVNNAVSVMTVSGGMLYAGGTFTMAGGSPANYVAQWDGSAWSPLGPGVGGSVNALAVDGANNVYVGGGFLSAGGKVAGCAACLMATASPAVDTSLALSATPNPAPYAQPVNLIAAVTNLAGTSTPFGNVVFLESGTPLSTNVLYGSGARATAVFSPTNLALGLHTITAGYAGNGTFNASTNTCDVTITQGWQVITFRPIADQVSTAILGLQATASSGLPVTFAVASGPATISNGTNLSFSGTGVVAIVASQAGNAKFNPAPDVTNTFAVRAQFALTVFSDLGTGTPWAGAHTNFYGTVLTNSVTTPVVQGGTQYVCAGWTMSGNDPTRGQSNSLVMTLTNNAALTWLWTTNPPCALTIVSAHGTATPATGVRTNFAGTVLTNSVTSPVMQNGTQYVCVGWSLAGNEPATGTTNRLVMTQTNNAVLTWLWITNPPPKLSVTPATLDFGTVVVGQTSWQPFYVVNTGGQTLTGSAWSYGGGFDVDSGSSSYSLSAGQTGTVWATCTAPWASSFSGNIQFDSNGGTVVNQVEATAIWPGWLRAWSAPSVDLGVIATGTTAQATFTLINYGDVPVSVNVAPPDAPFAIASESAFTLDGWATTNVVISFTPQTAGDFSADVVISSTGGDVTNTVTGAGAIPYTLVIAPSAGGCTPPPGAYTNFAGTVLTNTALIFDVQGDIHYACIGWTMTGNEPVSGTGTCVVMTVTNDAVLTWLWATNYWNGDEHTWTGASASSDSIDDPDNWANGVPNPGDNVRLDNTCARQYPLAARGADTYFGEITLGFWNGNGMTWCGDKTRLLLFGNGNGWYGNTLTSEADLANRLWPASDLQINPWGGGIIVSNVDIQDGMQLQVYGGNKLTVNGALTQNGSGDATLAIYDSATVVLNGPLQLTGAIALGNGTLVCGGSLSRNWANDISGAGGMVKQGTGTLTLSGLNTFAGGVRIDAGLLLLGGAGAIPDQTALTLTGGALDLNGQALTVSSLAGTGGVITNSSTALTVDAAGDTTFGGTLAGTGSLVKRGAGTLSLGGSNTYSGETRIEGGTVRLPAGVSSHLLHRWSFNNGDLGDAVGGQAATIVQGTDVHATLGATQVTLPGGGWETADYISLGSNILPNGADAPATIEVWATQESVQFWSRIFDFGIDSNNYLEMAWSAGDDINSDFVEVTNYGGVWNTMAPYNLGTEYHIAMVITPGAGDSGQTLLQWYKMDAAGMTLRTGSMSLNWTLADLVQENMWLGVDKWGSTCANASYDEVRIWDTALSEAQLAANAVLGPDMLPASPTLPAATALTIANGSALDLSGACDQTIAALASTDGLGSQVILGSSSLAVGDAASTTFDGGISGPGTLVKQGAGTLTLSGANTCGATIVSNGLLYVSGAIGPGAVAVASGGTLGGTGVISGAVVSDGAVAIGDDATIWVLSLPSYEQHAGATLNIKVGGTTSPGADYDQISVSGAATIGGTLHVSLVNGYTPTLGDQVVIMQAAGGFSGGFTAIEGPSLDGGLSWYVTYESTTATLHAVHRNDQSIAFDPIADLEWTTPLTLQATASSGLPVSFTVLSGPATIADGSNVTFTAAGPVTIVATQPGNIDYWPASPVTNTFHAYGNFTLTIASDHGAATPLPGDYYGVSSETVLTNQVTPIEVDGNTHYVCTGWTLSGTIPASGSGTSMVMSVASDCVLTWLWATNYWNDTVQDWTGAGSTADTIDQGDNWSSWSPPSPGDNLSFSNTTGSRHSPRSNYGAASYFGNLISYDGAGGITWCGNKTWLLSFENNSDANPLVSLADLANRTGPDSDLAINPLGSGGIAVSNVDIQNGMTLQVNGANTLTVSGALTQSGTGSASLAMHGGGTVILNGSNTFAGGTWIDTGTLQIGTGGASGALGLGDVIDDGTLIYDRRDAQTWTNAISGSGSLAKQGDGTLTLAGLNTYGGATRIAGGVLQLAPVPASHLTHRWSFNGDLRDSAGGQTASIVAGSNAHVTWDSNQVTMPGGGWDTSDYISLGANILPNTADASVTIELWATQQSVQNWSRMFDFGASMADFMYMSWTQGTDLNSDNVQVEGYSAGNTMTPYALGVEYHIAMVITPGAGDGGQTLVQWYKMDASGSTLGTGSMSVSWDLSQLVQNNMWLGTSEFAPWYGDQNANASYDEVRIWDVALTESQLAANALLGPDALPVEPLPALVSPLPATTAVTLSGGGVLDLSNLVAQTVASIAATDGSGSQIRLHAANLTVGDATSTTFDGVLSGSAALIKGGAGTLTLTGANTYEGASVINQGALVVNGSIGAGGVTVGSGAALAGRGTAGGAVVSDGAVAPGDDGAIGALGLARYVQHGGATLNIRLAGAQAPGADYDHLSVGGDATLDGTLTVTLVNGYMPTTNDQFVVLQAGEGISGVFAVTNLPSLGAGLGWSMTYGSDFVLLQPVAVAGSSRTFTLEIVSAYGTAAPAPGLYTDVPFGTVLTNGVATPDTQGLTQYVCTGWVLSGNEPASGSDATVVMTLTNDAVLTWLWSTNYWLATAAGSHGSVTPASGWQAAGSTPTVTALPDPFYHFTCWTGDVGAGNPLSSSLSVPVDAPKDVAASFAENLTTNTGTPEWWLNKYLPGTVDFNAAALADADGDGASNWAEYIADTDPTNAASCFRIAATSNLADRVVVGFLSSANRVYALEACTNLAIGAWLGVDGQTNIPGTGGVQTLEDNTSGASPRFHRLRVSLP